MSLHHPIAQNKLKKFMEMYFYMENHHELFKIFCCNSEGASRHSVTPFFPMYFKWENVRNFTLYHRFIKNMKKICPETYEKIHKIRSKIYKSLLIFSDFFDVVYDLLSNHNKLSFVLKILKIFGLFEILI